MERRKKFPRTLYPLLVETKGPVPAEFESGYVAYEDLPDDQKHLRNLKASSDEDFDDDDEDFDDADEEADGADEDGEVLYDEDEGAL